MSIQVLFFLICSGKLLPKHIQDDYIDYDGHHFDVACFDPSSVAALVLQICCRCLLDCAGEDFLQRCEMNKNQYTGHYRYCDFAFG